jgi:hypothetical protein
VVKVGNGIGARAGANRERERKCRKPKAHLGLVGGHVDQHPVAIGHLVLAERTRAAE